MPPICVYILDRYDGVLCIILRTESSENSLFLAGYTVEIASIVYVSCTDVYGTTYLVIAMSEEPWQPFPSVDKATPFVNFVSFEKLHCISSYSPVIG